MSSDRATTNHWESDFLFDVFDRTIVSLLQSEPRNLRHVAAVLREETDAVLRLRAIQCGRSPDEVESQGAGEKCRELAS